MSLILAALELAMAEAYKSGCHPEKIWCSVATLAAITDSTEEEVRRVLSAQWEQVFVTDFETIKMSPELVDELERRWPGLSYYTYEDEDGEEVAGSEPNWVAAVIDGICEMSKQAYIDGGSVVSLSSFDEIEPWIVGEEK